MRVGTRSGLSLDRPSSLGRTGARDIGGKAVASKFQGISTAVVDKRKSTIIGDTSLDANKRITSPMIEQDKRDWLTKLIAQVLEAFR